MPQILVLTDAPDATAEMVLSEHIDPVHLESRHSGAQLLERIAWAVRDAERAERRSRRGDQMQATMPPSTTSSLPLQKLLASDAR